MGATITNCLFIPDNNTHISGDTFYLLDNINGYIPGLQIDRTDGSKIWVINHSPSSSSYERRFLEYSVSEFEYTADLGWRKIISGRFNNNKMRIDDTTIVNSTTGAIVDPTLDEHGRVVIQDDQTTQFQFYINTLGKGIIFPAAQQGMAARFQDLL